MCNRENYTRQSPNQPRAKQMNDKIKNMIAPRLKPVEMIIQRKGIKAQRPCHGKLVPNQMDLVKMRDIGVGEDEHTVIKNKTVVKSLAVDQKPKQNKNQPTQKKISIH